jgi:hypothetical protein
MYHAYFLLSLAKLLPLTNGPKKDEEWKDEGDYVFSSYFLLLFATDWLSSASVCSLLDCHKNKLLFYETDIFAK